jgi:hypothetical protein
MARSHAWSGSSPLWQANIRVDQVALPSPVSMALFLDLIVLGKETVNIKFNDILFSNSGIVTVGKESVTSPMVFGAPSFSLLWGPDRRPKQPGILPCNVPRVQANNLWRLSWCAADWPTRPVTSCWMGSPSVNTSATESARTTEHQVI